MSKKQKARPCGYIGDPNEIENINCNPKPTHFSCRCAIVPIKRRTLPSSINYILSHPEKYSLEVRGTLLGLKTLIEDARVAFPMKRIKWTDEEKEVLRNKGAGEAVDVLEWFMQCFGDEGFRGSRERENP